MVECRTTHLNFVDEPLGSALYPCRVLGLGNLFVTNEVVPMLAPHVNVLVTIMGAPLDLLHFVVGGCLGLLALRATPSRGSGYQRTLTPTRGALWRRSLCPGWSWGLPIFSWRGSRGFVSPSATLLGGGVLVASSPLVGVLPPVVTCAGSSSTGSAAVITAGCSSVCSWAICLAAFSTATAGSVLWPATLSGSTSDAALATGDIMPTSKFTKKQVGRSAERQVAELTGRSACASP